MARSGYMQSSCAAGEIDPLLWFRHDIKYARSALKSGLARAVNVDIAPQGGFRLAAGTELTGQVMSDARRLGRFRNSQGESYDIVFGPLAWQVWDATAMVASGVHGLSDDQVQAMALYQHQDTMLMFHEDVETARLKQTATGWSVDTLPYDNVPRHDFGGDINGNPYTGSQAGTASVWEVQFFNIGATTAVDDTWITLQVSGEDTQAIAMVSTSPPSGGAIDLTATAANISAALGVMSIVAAGYSVAPHASKADTVVITFSGAGNLGDKWNVTGRVVNDADAAIVSVETTVGEEPGEPIISPDRGWPACGTFYQQSLIVAGLKALPNTWIKSVTGDPFNLDTSISAATGAMVVPMDIEGGERIVNVRAARNLVLFTDEAEFWISERKLSKSEAPVHVEGSRNGSRAGVPLAENEGALVYVHKNGDVISEFRYTDVDGNFVSQALTTLATHLAAGVTSIAQKKAEGNRDGNRIGYVQSDGAMRLVTVLREQEVTAFSRIESPGGLFRAVSVNGRNEMSVLVQRSNESGVFVNLERFVGGQLLHSAKKFTLTPAAATISDLDEFNGRQVWCIGDNDVFGPFDVSGGRITLPVAVSEASVGLWAPPLVRTLPLSRERAPGLVVQRSGRVTSVRAYVVDSTSLAVAANGSPPVDVDFLRYGVVDDGAELEQGYTGWVELVGFQGNDDNLQVEFTQVRPGRLTVACWVIEAEL